jgi:hypothetical protein
MPPRRRAGTAPRSASPNAPGTAPERVWQILRDDFAVPFLAGPPDFLIVVEGDTDRGYLQRAADQLRDESGTDLLAVPEALRRGPLDRIAIVVPKHPGQPISGGVDRMVDLARTIMRDVFTADAVGVVFLFDHDGAGRQGRDMLQRYGYKPDVHTLTLDPSAHPRACITPGEHRPDVVVEDLIPLSLQQRFFDGTAASCDVQYRQGRATRFRWVHPSKGELRRFIVRDAEMGDLAEFRSVLTRVRRAFGFPS